MDGDGGSDKPRRQSYAGYELNQSENSSLAEYMEISGANSLLINALAELFEEPVKPENPFAWLHSHFRQRVPKRPEADFMQTKSALKDEILTEESTIILLKVEEHKLISKLSELQFESQNIQFLPPNPNHDEDFRRYKDFQSDPRWRICPDPSIVVTKSDTLVQAVENEGRSKSQFFKEKSQILLDPEVTETTEMEQIEVEAEGEDE